MFHLLIESFNQFPFAILSTLYFTSFPLIYYKITINTTHFEIYDFFGLVIWTTLKKIIIYRYLMTNLMFYVKGYIIHKLFPLKDKMLFKILSSIFVKYWAHLDIMMILLQIPTLLNQVWHIHSESECNMNWCHYISYQSIVKKK